MTLEEAIRAAITYETRIRDLYREAAEKTTDPAGKRIYSALGDDEENHVAYLEHRLRQWKESGRITVERLASVMPPQEAFEREVGKVADRMSGENRKDEKQMLSRALAAEVETSAFYRKLVGEMSDESRQMFAGFLAIEEGHIAVVQAELDYLSHTGYWLDFKEFDME